MKQRQKMFTLAAALATGGALATAMLGDPAPPQVSVADVNPGTSVERDLCLSVSLAPGAASECGDLRLAHALPAVRTLNRARAPVLLYNSQHASPHPIVAAHVTLPSGKSGLSRVVATLKVNGTPRGQGVWRGSAWPDVTGPVRIAVGYDAASDSTGPYRYTLEVRAHYGETTLADTARGELVVVNRRESAFGAGWWLAGLERLVMDPFGKPVLWVGGDGSTRRYTKAGAGDVWGAPSLDRPDSIKREGEKWVRILSGGVKVEFDSTGRHVATVNRLTHRTEFRYDTAGRVEAVTIPQAAAGQEFAFRYAADGKLERMESPGVGSTPRETWIRRSGMRVDSIRDPDQTRVEFGYNGTSLVPVSRTNRLGVITRFRFNAGGRVTASDLRLENGDSIIMQVLPLVTRGLADAAGGGAVDTALAFSLINGPRTDVTDNSRLWLDRWGAPRRIRNAEERETVLTRGDPRFPARVDGPLRADGRRRTMAATYDARGNLVAQTDSSTSEERLVPDPAGGPASNQRVYATIRYEYADPRWPDFPTRTILPEGEATSFGYDPVSGSRIWQKPSGDVQRDDTVRFAYYESPAEQGYAPGLLRAVTYAVPPPEITERTVCGGVPFECTPVEDTVYPPPRVEKVEYDARGNLEYGTTALEFRTRYYNDELGRVWKTESPIEGGPSTNVVTTVNTFYENTDLVKESRTFAPNPTQTAWVRTQYDLEGRPHFVTRWSQPDPAGIDSITTEFRYDFAGRKWAEVAPDGRTDSTRFDPAGNPVAVWTRRGHSITMEYDSLNRLTRRVVPLAKYGPDARGIPGSRTNTPPVCSSTLDGQDNIYPFYPYFPTDPAECSLTLAAEVHEFGYDEDGRLVRADNSVSRVRRRYNLNGTLELDSLYVRTLDGQPNDPAAFSPHAYGMAHAYDLNGRPVSLSHPRQLAPVQNAMTRYSYDPRTGGLASVTDPLENRFTFRYDVHGQLDRVERPGGVVQEYGYDRDGRLELASLDVPPTLGGRLATTLFTHDARGKVLRTRNVAVAEDDMSARYSGLGHLVSETRRVTGQDQSGSSVRHLNDGAYEYEALGNSTLLRTRQATVLSGTTVSDETNGGRATYERRTGRQLTHETGAGPKAGRTDFRYDSAGNQDHQLSNSGPPTSVTRTDRVLYYGADNVLRAVERRTVTGLEGGQGSFEEYRNDALGRRIWVRTRNWCESQRQEGRCFFHTQERTVWDGDQALYEIQMSDTERENDTIPSRQDLLGSDSYDPNPQVGRVLLTHGPGIDQPLSVIRMGYREWEEGQLLWQAFAVVPLWDTQGRAPYMLFSNGARSLAPSFAPNGTRKLQTLWRLGRDAYGPANNAVVLPVKGTEPVWMGGVIADQQDASGLLYRRNRYYDPQTGRFTQEDPIGLAGGLNAYGFANGDPVSYSDPYGLAACPAAPAASGRHSPDISDCTKEELSTIGGMDEPLIMDPTNLIPVGALAKGWRFLRSFSRSLGTAGAARLTIGRATSWGWSGGLKYRSAVRAVANAADNATVGADDLGGVLPSRQEAERLIADAGGRIRRIERPHRGEGHKVPHINYWTASGREATIEVQSVGRQWREPPRGAP
jgi:RHS repeat-associated protein